MNTEIRIEVANGKLIVNPREATASRGSMIKWSTDLNEGVTIVPRQSGLTVLSSSAEVGSPATMLATNTGYYQLDVYWPKVDQLLAAGRGEPQRVVAILIISEFKGP